MAASVSPAGGIHSILTYDEDLGLVELTAHPPFADALRYDAPAVRAYRRTLAAPDAPAFGMRIDLAGEWEVRLRPDRAPVSELVNGDVRITVTTVAPRALRGVLQLWRFEPRRTCAIPCERLPPPALRRPAYPQLSEGGPLPPVEVDQRGWWTRCEAALAGFAGPVGRSEIRLRAGKASEGLIVYALGRPSPVAREILDEPVAAGDASLAYARICALRARDDSVCILADHRILPLSWNRDAYYVATLLRRRGEHELVRAHLRWLFGVAERRDSLWGRAHLANGRVKDAAFQLDQQCYPILEAVEAGEAATYAEAIRATLAALERRRERDLYPTAETPADDPMLLPFHFSSHVLLWHTLRALADAGFDVDAERVRRAALAAFTDSGRFAYATDARGRHHHYHDANDVPTVLAPAWGFCSAGDPIWRATIDFAWNDANAGHFSGTFGGLGSVHTRHPWPLGDLQRIIALRARGLDDRDAWTRLDRVATWDGLLPEAYDERDGSVASRHWFAWPAAVRALLAEGAF